MEEPKRKRLRLKGAHRWTEEQTRVLLQKVREATADDHKQFERPTSQQFYKIKCKDPVLEGIEWKMMRSKMRYLKSTYIKAIQWREQVGSELFQSDKAHVEARMKTISPYYNHLNAIFEPLLPADPIRLTDKDFSKYLPATTPAVENDLSTDNSDFDESEFDSIQNDSMVVIPKVENEPDDQSLAFEETSIRPTTKSKEVLYTVNQTNHDDFFDERTEQEHEENSLCYKSQFELECAKFTLERKKHFLDLQYRKDQRAISKLQLNFEREKFEFEKRKFTDDQRLRKYEIDKQFESKRLESEKDERLRRLELECKYRYKPNDEVMNYNEKSNYL